MKRVLRFPSPLLVPLVLGVLSVPAVRAAAPEEAAAALAPLEAAVAAAPENLRAASDYRHAVIRAGAYDRALALFEKLAAEHPGPNVWLNYGYAYVDKIPAAGSISQVILANEALKRFTRAIELKQGWLALYTRGNSYLYWPKIFGRAPLGVADLEQALALVKKEEKRRRVHARVYTALGDGYWKTDQPDKARAVWKEGLALFPGEAQMEERIARAGNAVALEDYLYEQLDPNRRVDTDLSPLWAEE